MKVTLHVPGGETITMLRQALAVLDPGAALRGVSGRAGVLVDEPLALAYLALRSGICGLSGAGLEPLPEPAVSTEAPAPTETAPESVVEAEAPPVPRKAAAKKAAAKKTPKEG